MKTRQKQQKILSFEGGSREEIVSFIEKNAKLLQIFLLHFDSPIEQDIVDKLDSLGLTYWVGNLPQEKHKPSQKYLESACKTLDSMTNKTTKEPIKPHNSNNINIDSIQPQIKISPKHHKPMQDKIFERIRSGEEVQYDGSIVVLGNVANGARVKAGNNVIIFGDCKGSIDLNGEFLILRYFTSGYINFQGEIMSPQIIAKINQNHCLKIIKKINGKVSNSTSIEIKELNETTNH